MSNTDSGRIDFEILLRSPGSKRTPHVDTIDQFRPDVEAVEYCRRWLSDKGVTCYPTEFGLVCSASKELFESLFSTKIEPVRQMPGKPPWRFLSGPKPPSEIAHYIEQIEIPAPPELF
jgi:hypothetical protein